MLQAQPLTTGREIAERLGIDARTVRRYIAALQALDIPVEGQRGVGGGYRVRPGYRLPPLMLNDDEAVAVVLGLIGARGSAPDAETSRSTARSRRSCACCPPRCARQVEALEQTLGFTAAPPSGAPVGGGARCCSPTRSGAAGASASPTARSRASATQRDLSPHGLVVHAGRWYLAAHDHVPRRPAHVPRRSHAAARVVARAARVAAARRLRRRRAREPRRSPACRGDGRSRCCSTSRSTRPRRACPRRSRSSRRGRPDAPAHARQLARLDGGRARRARLRLQDPRAGRAARERGALAERLAACA